MGANLGYWRKVFDLGLDFKVVTPRLYTIAVSGPINAHVLRFKIGSLADPVLGIPVKLSAYS